MVSQIQNESDPRPEVPQPVYDTFKDDIDPDKKLKMFVKACVKINHPIGWALDLQRDWHRYTYFRVNGWSEYDEERTFTVSFDPAQVRYILNVDNRTISIDTVDALIQKLNQLFPLR